MTRLIAALGAIAVLSLAGCGGPGVDDVCNVLDQKDCASWSGVDECIDAGIAIQERVDREGGCDGAFDLYRLCLVEEASCNWESACSAERAALEGCIGEL